MATLVPRTWVANEIPTAANVNQELRDNFNRTETALAETAGYVISNSTAEDELRLSTPLNSYIHGEISYSPGARDNWYTGVGPTITVPAVTNYLVFASCRINSATNGSTVYFGVRLDGDTAVTAETVSYRRTEAFRTSMCQLIPNAPDVGQTTRTIEMVYYVALDTNTGYFAQRKLTVIPLG